MVIGGECFALTLASYMQFLTSFDPAPHAGVLMDALPFFLPTLTCETSLVDARYLSRKVFLSIEPCLEIASSSPLN